MELTNAAAAFRERLLQHQINWTIEPMLAGPSLIDLVIEWHEDAALYFKPPGAKQKRLRPEPLDLVGSKYCVLHHDTKWNEWQMVTLPLDLKTRNPLGEIEWEHKGKSLNGYIDDDGRRHLLWQVYPTSGGQMKYFPLLEWAEWSSPRFYARGAAAGRASQAGSRVLRVDLPAEFPVT